jgi:hypothetical protein
MKTRRIEIVFYCLTLSLSGGCQNKQDNVKSSVSVVSKMATAAAKEDYVGGIAIGETYLRENPGNTAVLEQTAVLTLAEAKRDQNNREPLVARAVLLLERSVKSGRPRKDNADLFERFLAARDFESAGDLSSDRCTYYKRALALDREVEEALAAETLESGDEKAVTTKPLKEQSGRLQPELEKRMSESRCGSEAKL